MRRLPWKFNFTPRRPDPRRQLAPGADPGDADALFGPDVTIKRIRRAKKDVISNYEELRKVLVANDLTALLDDH